MKPGFTMARRHVGRGNVMPRVIFFWETVGPVIQMDVTSTCTTYLNIVADYEKLFIKMVFPHAVASF